MTIIKPDLIKRLRDATDAGFAKCQEALKATNGDFDAAVDYLRKIGEASASKKAGRIAADGLIVIHSLGTSATVAEINSETDFVARNEKFQAFVQAVGETAAKATLTGDGTALGALKNGGSTLEEQRVALVAGIGENITLRRAKTLKVSSGLVATYVHSAINPTMGKIGVLVALESSAGKDVLEPLGKQIAMHVAATNPLALTPDEVDSSAVERERNVLAEQARAQGKPEDVIKKMVDGRMSKFYQENALLEQIFVVDNETPIKTVVSNAATKAGTAIKLTGFVRFALGEGIEKVTKDFAAEVAAAAKIA